MIQDSSPRVPCNLGSWILKFNVVQHFNMGLRETVLKYWAALGVNMVDLCGDEMTRDT